MTFNIGEPLQLTGCKIKGGRSDVENCKQQYGLSKRDETLTIRTDVAIAKCPKSTEVPGCGPG